MPLAPKSPKPEPKILNVLNLNMRALHSLCGPHRLGRARSRTDGASGRRRCPSRGHPRPEACARSNQTTVQRREVLPARSPEKDANPKHPQGSGPGPLLKRIWEARTSTGCSSAPSTAVTLGLKPQTPKPQSPQPRSVSGLRGLRG